MTRPECDGLDELVQVIEALLGPGGCPWDQEQTPRTLCDYLVEETFELVEAIRSGKTDDVREELGDVMFLLLFVVRLHRGTFDLADVLRDNAAKMIGRHPHVFGDTVFKNREELLVNWERIKRREKAGSAGGDGPAEGAEGGAGKSLYASLPKGLPPLLKAYRIHSKAARTGFTWASDADMERSLRAEWAEWEQAKAGKDQAGPDQAAAAQAAMEGEFGDYLFSLVEYGRRHRIKASAALETANLKFLGRYQAMEQLAAERGLDLGAMNLDELNGLWDEVKGRE
jgi:ATP diphosphatase